MFDQPAGGNDPVAVARLAAEAEEAGWHGVFVWDHLRWRAPVRQVADPWITLAAIATATERMRLGPMVTPLARRRPAKVARETATLDRLSDGRLTLGVGLGSDRFGGELSMTGEQLVLRPGHGDDLVCVAGRDLVASHRGLQDEPAIGRADSGTYLAKDS
jgi:Luciferase-like monooxygenase